jgi:hypothetical protein
MSWISIVFTFLAAVAGIGYFSVRLFCVLKLLSYTFFNLHCMAGRLTLLPFITITIFKGYWIILSIGLWIGELCRFSFFCSRLVEILLSWLLDKTTRRSTPKTRNTRFHGH